MRQSISSIRHSEHTQTQNGLTDEDTSNNIARRLMEQYDRSRTGTIDRNGSVSMLLDTYRKMNNRTVNPSSQEIDGFYKVLDRNRDGRITLPDLESLCRKYLVNGSLDESRDY